MQQLKATPLARDLTRVFNSYNKHTVQLKKNLKETNVFFREIRQNYSNSTMSSDSASLDAGKHKHLDASVLCKSFYLFLKHHKTITPTVALS